MILVNSPACYVPCANIRVGGAGWFAYRGRGSGVTPSVLLGAHHGLNTRSDERRQKRRHYPVNIVIKPAFWKRHFDKRLLPVLWHEWSNSSVGLACTDRWDSTWTEAWPMPERALPHPFVSFFCRPGCCGHASLANLHYQHRFLSGLTAARKTFCWLLYNTVWRGVDERHGGKRINSILSTRSCW